MEHDPIRALLLDLEAGKFVGDVEGALRFLMYEQPTAEEIEWAVRLDMKDELDGLISEVSSLEHQVMDLEEENEKLVEKIEALEAEIEGEAAE